VAGGTRRREPWQRQATGHRVSQYVADSAETLEQGILFKAAPKVAAPTISLPFKILDDNKSPPALCPKGHRHPERQLADKS
jgi:hypothetical protein